MFSKTNRGVGKLTRLARAVSRLFVNDEQGAWYDAYDPNLLLQRRNLLLWSERLTAADGWNIGPNITANGQSGTLAGVTAWSFTSNATNNSYVQRTFTPTPGKVYTASFLTDNNGGASNVRQEPGGQTTAYTYEQVGPGVYRGTATFTVTPATTSVVVHAGPIDSTASTTFKATAVQLELGGSFSAYQKVTDWREQYMQAVGNSIALFQDDKGWSPVTAVEQPVGLILDKRLGLKRGADVITNGTFDTNTTSWQADGAATLASVAGELVVTSGGAPDAQAAQNITYSVGKTYELLVTARKGTSTQYEILAETQSTSMAGRSGSETVPTLNRLIFTVPAGATFVAIRLRAVGAGTAIFDNVSVREIYGNHYTQGTSTSRLTLRARYNRGLKTRGVATTVSAVPAANALEWGFSAVHGDPLTNNTAVGPDGVASASTLTFGTADWSCYAHYNGLIPGVSYKWSCAVKLGTATNFCVVVNNTTAWDTMPGEQSFDASNGGLSTTTWKRVSITFVAPAGGVVNLHIGRHLETGLAQQTAGTVLFADHDLRYDDDAALNIPAYQRVNSATDYDTIGFPHYLRADGTDDYGLTTVPTTAVGIILMGLVADQVAFMTPAGSGGQAATEVGTGIKLRDTGAVWTSKSNGTVSSSAQLAANTYKAGMALVAGNEWSTTLTTAHANMTSLSAAADTIDPTTSNVFHIGRGNSAGGSHEYFNGRIYSVIIRGVTTTAAQIADAKRYIALKMGKVL